jgi:hypothetical protein
MPPVVEKAATSADSSEVAGAPANDSFQKRLKVDHSVANQLRKMLDRYEDRPRLDNLRLAQRYAKAEIHILLEFFLRDASQRFVAILEKAIDVRRPEAYHGLNSQAHRLAGYESATPRRSEPDSYSDERPMLVDIVESVEGPEIVSLPTFVWFERAERVYGLLPHALYFSASMSFVFRGARRNIKTGLLPKSGSATSNEIELSGEIIEGRPKVVQGIPQNCWDSRIDQPRLKHVNDWLSGLRIALGADSIGAPLVEGADRAIEIKDMLVGPFDFMPYGRQPLLSAHWFRHATIQKSG